MNKYLWIIFCVIILTLTMASASAENISRWGITEGDRWWLVGTSSVAPFVNNWTTIGTSVSMPLVFDINNDGVNEIIQNRAGLLRVFSLNGTLIASKNFGSSLGSRMITAYESDNCPNNNSMFVMETNPASVTEYCLTGSTISSISNCTLENGSTTADATGAAVKRINGDIISTFIYINSTSIPQIAICNHTNSSLQILNIDPSLYPPGATPITNGIPALGNPFNDGDIWGAISMAIGLGAPSYNTYNYIVLYDLVTYQIKNLTPLSFPIYNGAFNMQPQFIQRGSGNPDDLLAGYSVWFSGIYSFNYRQMWWFGDATGYGYPGDFDPDIGSAPATYRGGTYAVQLGQNGDICWFRDHSNSGTTTTFFCLDPTTGTHTFSKNLTDLHFSGSFLVNIQAADLNSDGYADFLLPYAYNNTNSSWQSTICEYTPVGPDMNCRKFGAGAGGDWLLAGDFNIDGWRDILQIDQGSNLLRVFLTSQANPPFCNDTDIISYPSIDFNVQGVMTATNITPRTDYCNGNQLLEYYCDNSTSPHPVPIGHSCSSEGKICQNGACVNSSVNGTCDDTDSIIYPTINYNMSGTLTTVGNTTEYFTDFCTNQGQLIEYYCANPNTPVMANLSVWCSGNMACVNGACSNQTHSCTDDDSYTYPTTNPLMMGSVNITIGNTSTLYPDVCINSTTLQERSCINYQSTTPTITWVACNGTCSNGQCSAGSACDIYIDTYSYPYTWAETFGYTDSITNHGWLGYGWIVGDNPYDICNILFMDANLNLNDISHTLNPPPSNLNYTIYWDMALESSLNSTNYIPNGMETKIIIKSSGGAPLIELDWSQTGNIYGWNGSGNYTVVGNWQNIFNSYQIVVHPETHTYDFYYTNSTGQFQYMPGGLGLNYQYNYTATRFAVEPQGKAPYNFSVVGTWIDNIRVREGGIQNATPVYNFCNFTGCIYYDDFNYNDSTDNYGWGLYNTTPSTSVVTISNNTYGYYFDHNFDTFLFTDAQGIITFQFKANFPQPPTEIQDLTNFYVFGDDLSTPIVGLEFANGMIFDNRGILNRGILGLISWGASTGSYAYNTWDIYTIVLNLNTQSYDLYKNSKKIASGVKLTDTYNSVQKVSFWTNYQNGYGSSIKIDWIKVAEGTSLVKNIGGTSVTIDPITGVPESDTVWCWSKTNGSFNWDCCTADENVSKSFWCPVRTTFRYALGGVTNFVLMNFIYFLIIVIVFVLIAPYIAPRLRGR